MQYQYNAHYVNNKSLVLYWPKCHYTHTHMQTSTRAQTHIKAPSPYVWEMERPSPWKQTSCSLVSHHPPLTPPPPPLPQYELPPPLCCCLSTCFCVSPSLFPILSIIHLPKIPSLSFSFSRHLQISPNLYNLPPLLCHFSLPFCMLEPPTTTPSVCVCLCVFILCENFSGWYSLCMGDGVPRQTSDYDFTQAEMHLCSSRLPTLFSFL